MKSKFNLKKQLPLSELAIDPSMLFEDEFKETNSFKWIGYWSKHVEE